MNIEVICIDASHRPNEIPTSRWLKKGETYHIIQIDKLLSQGGIYGCKLAEINNDDLVPYQYFRLSRFAIPIDIKEESEITEEMLEEIDISEIKRILEPVEQEA
jgi:hypothetical protein